MSDITVRFEQVPDTDADDAMHMIELLARQLTGRDCRARVVDESGLIVVAPTRPHAARSDSEHA